MYLFARFDQGLAFFALGGLDGLVDDALGLFLRAGYLALGYLFTVHDAQQESYDQHHDRCDHGAEYFP